MKPTAWLVQLEFKRPDRTTTTAELRGERWLLGRLGTCDLVIPAGNLASREQQLAVRENQVFLETTSSSCSTWVDGKRVRGPVVIQPHNRVYVGSFSYRLLEEPVPLTGPDALHRVLWTQPLGPR